MRRRVLSTLALAAALPVQAAPPTAAQCAQAQASLPAQVALWRGRLAQRLNLREAELTPRLNVLHSEALCWNGGISLVVRYTWRYDWALVPGQDSQALLRTQLPGGDAVAQPAFLTAEQLASASEQAAPDTQLMLRQAEAVLAFASAAQAEAALMDALHPLSGQASVALRSELAFYVPGAVPRINGQPWMLARATLDEAANRCASGQLNLVTGRAEVREMPCRVSGGPARAAP